MGVLFPSGTKTGEPSQVPQSRTLGYLAVGAWLLIITRLRGFRFDKKTSQQKRIALRDRHRRQWAGNLSASGNG
jgi:hypothetical protein